MAVPITICGSHSVRFLGSERGCDSWAQLSGANDDATSGTQIRSYRRPALSRIASSVLHRRRVCYLANRSRGKLRSARKTCVSGMKITLFGHMIELPLPSKFNIVNL